MANAHDMRDYGGPRPAERDMDTRPPAPPTILEQCRTITARLNELGSMTRHLIAVLIGERPADPKYNNPKISSPPDASTVSAFMHQIGDSLSEAEMNLNLLLQEIGK